MGTSPPQNFDHIRAINSLWFFLKKIKVFLSNFLSPPEEDKDLKSQKYFKPLQALNSTGIDSTLQHVLMDEFKHIAQLGTKPPNSHFIFRKVL